MADVTMPGSGRADQLAQAAQRRLDFLAVIKKINMDERFEYSFGIGLSRLSEKCIATITWMNFIKSFWMNLDRK